MSQTDLLLSFDSTLLLVTLIALAFVLKRSIGATQAAAEISGRLGALEKAHERTERVIGDTVTRTRDELANEARAQRQELGAAFKSFGDAESERARQFEHSATQRLDGLANGFQTFATASHERADQLRVESNTGAAALRTELINALKQISETLTTNFGQLASGQKVQLDRFSTQLESFEKKSTERLDATRTEMTQAQQQHRQTMAMAIAKLEESNEKKLESIRTTVEGRLRHLQEDNAKQLEQMRHTVDEKLQSTLEKRLGESFKQVSERLEQVHKGLGEMQTLATGVGDLKKVLTNVKTRGTWGEVQLGALLEQVLNQDQYAANVATKDGRERVEFAIKLPGQGNAVDSMVWLPIDAKFPIEDYQRLLEAQDRADVEAMDAAGKALEARVKAGAADISKKYLNPPATTDFAILFLPIEGLFAEVARRVALLESVQREHRVVVAGPTTLWSILNSLQMGFRTLAIQKRSSEVWNLLAAVKTEWTKYGDVLAAVQKKLHQASESIEKVHVRSRAVGRKLRDVQELPVADADAVLATDGADGDFADEADEGSALNDAGSHASLRH